MASGLWTPLAIGTADGPTLTAAAAATAIPVTAKYTFPPNSLQQGSRLWIQAAGRVSAVVTTPGTFRIDLRLGSTVIADTGALALKTTVSTTLPWSIEWRCTIRTAGSAATVFSFYNAVSEVFVGGQAQASGSAVSIVASGVGTNPETAPAVGGNTVDLTASNTFDMFFTQTVATGSFTVHDYCLSSAAVGLA